MSASDWTEPGRSVAENGQIVYEWPPQGRFDDLWARFASAFPDDTERHEILALLLAWRDDGSVLAAYTDENGDWVDVEPDWSLVEGWMVPPSPTT